MPRGKDEAPDDYEEGYQHASSDDGGISKLIPYKNTSALTAYYCGVFSLIPCLGLILGPLAMYFGYSGLNYANQNPQAQGKVHAIVGLVLGGLTALANWGVILMATIGFVLAALEGPR
ncbi:MAG: hypothetical protein NZM31_09410 [Gemmatales bacterium]|nr:hypothetical protein [Gemmatales bacterium]MDW8387211.1 hypothetical protein [Gemmatales bacterium]